jgi:hypothetical protein
MQLEKESGGIMRWVRAHAMSSHVSAGRRLRLTAASSYCQPTDGMRKMWPVAQELAEL